MLKRHLDLAERHVLDGQEHIARQREIVAQLEHRHRESITFKNGARAIQGNGRSAEASHGRQGRVARAAPALRTSNAVAVREYPLQLADVRR